MKPTPSESDLWDNCPPGLLQETAKASPRNSGGGFLLGSALALLVISAFLVFWYPSPETRENVQTDNPVVDCQMVQQNMVAFVKYEIKDCSLYSRMGCHIYNCRECLKHYQQACDHPACAELPREVILKPKCKNCPTPTP